MNFKLNSKQYPRESENLILTVHLVSLGLFICLLPCPKLPEP